MKQIQQGVILFYWPTLKLTKVKSNKNVTFSFTLIVPKIFKMKIAVDPPCVTYLYGTFKKKTELAKTYTLFVQREIAKFFTIL